MKNAFYFILKALFILKIVTLFGHVMTFWEFKLKTCFTYVRFMIVIFLEMVFTINQITLAKMRAGTNGISLEKRGMHFIHININSLLPKIDEGRYIANIKNASIIGISETKLDETIWSNELEVDGYDLVRFDRSRRGRGVACCIESSIAYSYKESFCSNTESIFVEIFLPKSKSILFVILYRPPDKLDFVKHINNVFIETGVLGKQEFYLLRDLNINLILDEKDLLSNKSYISPSQTLPPLTKVYLDFCFYFILEQLISIPTRVTSKAISLTDHVLTNSSQKVRQFCVIELDISHDLVYYTRKTPSLKPNKHNGISVRSLKNYTKEKFLEVLKKTNFPDHTTFTCLNKAFFKI